MKLVDVKDCFVVSIVVVVVDVVLSKSVEFVFCSS